MALYQRRRGFAPVAFGSALILGALGAVGVIVSLFLPWRTGSVHLSDIPVAFLWDRGATSGLSLLILMVPLAIILTIGAFVPFGAGLRLFAAIGTLIVVVLFAYQLHRAVDAFGGSLGDALDTGFYFAGVGGILALVSAWGRSRRL
jgi:hypothetical protein